MNNKIQEKLGQWGQRSVLLLQGWWLGLLTKINPALEQWQGQLSGAETEANETNKFLVQVKKLGANLAAKVLPLTQKWQADLQALPPEPFLPPHVQQELGVAWEFVQTKLVPRLLAFTQTVVDQLDPKLQQFYGWLGEKSAQFKPLANFQSSPLKARLVTALLPIDRLIQEGAPAKLKPVVAKRSATYTILIALILFILFKPSPARTAKEVNPPVIAKTPLNSKSVIPPDRILVTDIQNQVAKVSKLFGEGLIQNVQANFRLGKLVVLVTDDWYQLSPFQQDQMMDSLLEESVSLGFKKLLLADTHQTLIARNPDVGIKMVVLARQPK